MMRANDAFADKLVTLQEDARLASVETQDIGARVHAITLKAIEQRDVSLSEIRSVLSSVTDGVQLGLAQRGGEIAQALREAVGGMDSALVKFAQRIQLSVEESIANGKEFREGELKQSLETLRDLEKSLVETLRKTADQSSGVIKTEMSSLSAHLTHTGTDAGGQALATLAKLSEQAHGVVHTGKIKLEQGSRDIAGRVVQFTGGVLTGVGEALRNRSK
jgi:hypothetical protein